MRWIRFAGILIVLTVLEVEMPAPLRPFGTGPDLLVCFALALALHADDWRVFGPLWGIGLARDVMSLGPFGFHAILLGGGGVAVWLARDSLFRHHVITLDPRAVFHPGFWKRIREFAPDVIHYVPGPSLKSFGVMRAVSLAFPVARTIMSAPMPGIFRLATGFVRFLKPDLMLAQSKRMESKFREWGLVAEFCPVSGVDVHKFRPASDLAKERLRTKYEIGEGQFVVLHAGHVKAKRNVQLLKRIQLDGIQTVVVGSTSAGLEADLRDDLVATGCRVITDYVERIDEIYRLSDCYVFPTPRTNRFACIEIPLSVLEAASCNLPIISTRFGALPELFDDLCGFVFAETDDEIQEAVFGFRDRSQDIATRTNAVPFSWDNIAQTLEQTYEKVCREPGNA